MLTQVSRSRGTPTGVVTAFIRAAAKPVCGVLQMVFTINARIAEVRTPRIPARTLGITRHIIAPFAVVSRIFRGIIGNISAILEQYAAISCRYRQASRYSSNIIQTKEKSKPCSKKLISSAINNEKGLDKKVQFEYYLTDLTPQKADSVLPGIFHFALTFLSFSSSRVASAAFFCSSVMSK